MRKLEQILLVSIFTVSEFQKISRKKMAFSNWEKKQLDLKAVHYASLDVFITGTIVRQLNYQFKNNKMCEKCKRKLGVGIEVSVEQEDFCEKCKRRQNLKKQTNQGNQNGAFQDIVTVD
eukprot:TRINITY_DN25636_c0_g1_i1.p4 TRINITY_DN25636_c0_g1~~TRINITY_DN25636_c0_g1_i1.p4  ORF type:complete len:119 (-),score=20.70 TRINITY_DN25636_c0_g1_i1:112-468(-)